MKLTTLLMTVLVCVAVLDVGAARERRKRSADMMSSTAMTPGSSSSFPITGTGASTLESSSVQSTSAIPGSTAEFVTFQYDSNKLQMLSLGVHPSFELTDDESGEDELVAGSGSILSNVNGGEDRSGKSELGGGLFGRWEGIFGKSYSDDKGKASERSGLLGWDPLTDGEDKEGWRSSVKFGGSDGGRTSGIGSFAKSLMSGFQSLVSDRGTNNGTGSGLTGNSERSKKGTGSGLMGSGLMEIAQGLQGHNSNSEGNWNLAQLRPMKPISLSESKDEESRGLSGSFGKGSSSGLGELLGQFDFGSLMGNRMKSNRNPARGNSNLFGFGGDGKSGTGFGNTGWLFGGSGSGAGGKKDWKSGVFGSGSSLFSGSETSNWDSGKTKPRPIPR